MQDGAAGGFDAFEHEGQVGAVEGVDVADDQADAVEDFDALGAEEHPGRVEGVDEADKHVDAV